jgi:hypothetical protein
MSRRVEHVLFPEPVTVEVVMKATLSNGAKVLVTFPQMRFDDAEGMKVVELYETYKVVETNDSYYREDKETRLELDGYLMETGDVLYKVEVEEP